MKRRFTLTFDDYLECHDVCLLQTESIWPGILACVGIGLLALGYISLRGGCEGIIAGVVLFAGLGVTASTVPAWFGLHFLQRLNLKKAKALLQKEFDAIHSGQREVESTPPAGASLNNKRRIFVLGRI